MFNVSGTAYKYDAPDNDSKQIGPNDPGMNADKPACASHECRYASTYVHKKREVHIYTSDQFVPWRMKTLKHYF
jgi:hypothetical protein